MYLSVFAGVTKTCQGPIGLSDCALELVTCPPSLTNGLRLPQESQHKLKWEASHPHALTPASELRPAFYLQTFSQTGQTFSQIRPSTACIPNPLLTCPSTIFQLSPLKSRKEVSSKKIIIFTSNMTLAKQPRPHLPLTYCLFLCFHLTMTLAGLSYSCVPLCPTCVASFLDFW